MRNGVDVYMGGYDEGKTPSVQQYDENSREYQLNLWVNEQTPYLLPEGAAVGVVYQPRGQKPTEEYKAEILTRSTVLVRLPSEVTKKRGRVEMQLLIHTENGVLHSPVINFEVLRSLKPGEGEGGEPEKMLSELISEANTLMTAFEKQLSEDGFRGPPGPAGKIVKVNATIDGRVGKPTVSVGTGGTPEALELYLDFGSLKGAQGFSPVFSQGVNIDPDGRKETHLYIQSQTGSQTVVITDGYTPKRGVDYWTEEDLAQMQAGFLPSTAGAVANANIADRAINNAKLDYDSVTNAKIRAGTIQTDRLTAEAQRLLTGGPYMQISMDGSTRVNITQGKHVFGLRRITDTARNLDTWLLNHSTWDGVYLHQGTDIEGPMLMLGRSDFIGGIHGDEHMTSVRMIADGVDVTGSTVELGNVKVFAVYVESKVYDVDSSIELFTRQKVLTFHGNRLTVENRWTYTGAAMDYVQRWPGCGLYSVYTSNALGVRTNENLMPSMQAQDWNQKITEAEFWVSGMHVTMRALRGMENADYAGSVEMLDGSARIKVYLDTIHSPEGHAVSAGDVLQASYEIVINE